METAHPTEQAPPHPEHAALEMADRQPVELEVEKLVYGGEGLGRLATGEVILIPEAVPGETVRVHPQPGKPLRGTVATIINSSPDRTNPACHVFGVCGGCSWQHLQIEAQRQWKTRIVAECLQRIGKLTDIPVLPALGTDVSAWAYRNRAQWDVKITHDRQVKLGYHAAQSADIVEFERCHILPDSLNALALQIRLLLNQKPQLAQGLLRVEAVQNQQGQFLLLLEALDLVSSKALAKELKNNLNNLVGVSLRNPDKPFALPMHLLGEGFVEEQLGEYRFRISAGSFFQTNLHGAKQLLDTLDQLIQPNAKKMLDLYAGVGVFALHFSDRMSRVLAIESAPTSVADARQNIQFNQVQNVEFIQGDVRKILAQRKENFDVAIVDPPRSGCQPEVLNWLGKHIQKQILYVSCNPSTMARDLSRLVASGWSVKQVQPIDMFPQTYHIECIAQLERSN